MFHPAGGNLRELHIARRRSMGTQPIFLQLVSTLRHRLETAEATNR
jgi:hypothetical protein